jgi:CubicO group peptidase (beta-lactamase class C family)
MRRYIILIFCFAVISTAEVNSQGKNSFSPVENLINQKITSGTIPSVTVAVAEEGNLIYEKAFGWADVENKIKSTPDMSYQLASATKPITATGLMVLNRKGIINIDSSVEDYIKPLQFHEYEGKSSDVTIKHLLNHTSGLGTYFDITYADEEVQFVGFEEAFKRYGNLYHPSGVICEYSNLGYGLIDHIISKQSGKSFAQYMENEVFTPLGMRNSFVGKTNRSDMQIAKKYGPGLKALPEIYNNTPGAGSIYSSIHDLILFGMFHLKNNVRDQKKILDNKDIDLMRDFKDENVLYHHYDSAYYGLGWYCKPNDKGYKIVWHEGGVMGASSIIKLIPEENIAIAVITNIYNNPLCQRIANELSKIILPDYNPTSFDAVANYKPYTTDSTYFGEWKGHMKVDDLDIPCNMTFKPDGNVIFDYLDFTFKSDFFTQNNPIPHKTILISALINKNSFMGTFPGILPSKDIRREYSHFMCLKLLKNENRLTGTIVAIPAADREYYAYPFYIKLEKQK